MKTIIKASFLFLLLFACLSSNAQIQQWERSYTGLFQGSIDQSWAIAVDIYGNTYVTGMSDNAIATVKYSPSGIQLWAKRYGGGSGFRPNVGYSIAVTPTYDGQFFIYVTGQTLTDAQGYDYITLQYDDEAGNPNPIWVQTYNGPGSGDDIAYFVSVDMYGNSYITGQSAGRYTGQDYATIKYDVNGALQWLRRYNSGGNDMAYALSVSGGNVYVTGTCNGGASQVTVAYDNNGVPLWETAYSPGFQFVNEMHNCIAADYLHGVYVTGIGGNQLVTIKYDPFSGIQQWAHADYSEAGRTIALFKKPCAGDFSGPDTWCYNVEVFVGGVIGTKFGIIKYDESGTEQWMRQYYNSAQGHYIGTDLEGSVYLTGRINEISTMDMGTVAYDNSGNYLWDKTFTGSGNAYDNAMGLAIQSGTKRVYVSGITTGSTTSQDYGTLLYAPMPDQPLTYNNGNTKSQFNLGGGVPTSFELKQNYPNPFNPSTDIRYAVAHDGNVKISVFDISGREVAVVVNEYKSTGYYNLRFDGSKLSSGVYVYKMVSGSFTEIKKMVLIK